MDDLDLLRGHQRASHHAWDSPTTQLSGKRPRPDNSLGVYKTPSCPAVRPVRSSYVKRFPLARCYGLLDVCLGVVATLPPPGTHVHASLNGGWWQLVVEFVEIKSGKRAKRPQLDAALAACKKHKAKLVVAKLDRLSRNVSFLLKLIDSGVEVLFADLPERAMAAPPVCAETNLGSFFHTFIPTARCPLWVISRHNGPFDSCPTTRRVAPSVRDGASPVPDGGNQ